MKCQNDLSIWEATHGKGEVFRLISSAAILAAVIIGVRAADKLVKQFKNESDEDIIDI